MHAIALEGISKRYRIYRRQRDRLHEALSLGRIKRGRNFWALKNIDLKIKPGASLGVLGRNGAGKSTLLQIIAGVLQPTTGTVQTNGRVSALLQLSAGFEREFTGRENAIMNGLLLGMDRREMLKRFDEIEAFAGLGEFMDQPVKNYSSGMRARLGFAVAVHVDPAILLVDEVLSVGDAAFARKGIQKMLELQDTGTTILFVSHSIAIVKEFATEAALLHRGRLIGRGDTSEIADQYETLLSDAAQGKEATTELVRLPEPEVNEHYGFEPSDSKEDLGLESRVYHSHHGTGEARIQNVEVLDEHGQPTKSVMPESTITVRVHARYTEDVSDSVFGITLRNATGLDIFSTDTKSEKIPIKHHSAGDQIIVDFSFKVPLRHGPYNVVAFVSRDQEKGAHLDRIYVGIAFEIDKPADKAAFGGLVYLPTQVTISEPERARNPERSV